MPTLSDIGRRFDPMREFIQQTQDGLNNLNSQLNNTRQQVHQNTSAIQQMIEALTQSMQGLREQAGLIVQGINNLSSASSRNRQTIQQEAATMDDLWAAYRKMGVEVKNLEVNLDTLNFSEKEMNKVVQLGTQYNKERSDSYNALSQKYRAIKILIDQMTVAERENTESGRNLVATAREMYEQMNLLQQRTGKYQLQVGDYSKAMTGLNIATNQVVRELPVLANGVSMFAIAISNNIPILVDNIVQVRRSIDAQKALKKELLENAAAYEAEGNAAAAAAARQSAAGIKTTSVISALGKAVFSWQTAIVLVLTVLPGLIRNIEKKKKAQEEEAKAQKDVNDATNDAAKAMKNLDDIYRDIRSSIQDDVTELQVLKLILDDTNRSLEERIDVGKRLKQIFDEELEGYTAEEIAMGNAAEKMQILTEEIYNQAKARASLNKITELTQKMIELEGQRDLYGNWQMGTKTIKEYADELERANQEGRSIRIGAVEMEYVEKYRAILTEMNSYQQQIDDLIEKIQPGDLLEKLKAKNGKPKATKETIADIPSFFLDAIKELISGMDAGFEKSLAELDVQWKERQEEFLKSREQLLKDVSKDTRENIKAASKIAKEMEAAFAGNVDLTHRPQIDARKLGEAGWSDAGTGIATVFSSSYGITDATGAVREILVTPILPDGSVLSEKQLEDYIFDTLEGAEDILKADKKGLVIAVDVDEESGEKLHLLQEQYYDLVNKIKQSDLKDWEKVAAELDNLAFLEMAAELNYEAARKALIKERLDSYKEVVADEGDVVAEEQKVIATGLKAEKKLRDAAAYEIYEMSERSAADKEALDAALRDSERKYWEDYLAGLREAGILTIEEYNTIMANLAKAVRQNEDRTKRGRKGRMYGGIVEAVLAQTSRFGEKDKYGIDVIKDEYKEFVSAIDSALKTSMGFMDEWMDKRLEMAKIAVEAAEREVAAAQKVLDFEMEARANGYANRVETARKELDLERENHRKALEEQRRLQEQQLLLDSISQTSSLITATANIWEAMTKGTGIFGPGLAIAATALLWGSFAASKIKAKQLAGLQAEQYGEGTVELLEGGSHASGHDIDLGVKKDGTRRRAEGGEFFAVINKRNSRRYRSIIPDVINSFNDGTFGDKYQKANEAMGNFALGVMAGNSPTDVSALERDVRAIREQGDEHRYVDTKGNTIIRYKNLTRKINRS